MIKFTPSNLKDSAFPYSKDPALIQLADDASEGQRKEHAHKWKVARETGDYSPLKADGEPTLFHLRPLTADAFTYLASHQPQDGAVLAFRFALKDVSNWTGFEMAWSEHPKLGRIASLEAFDKAGATGGMTVAIALELGHLVIERASNIRPS